MVRVVKLYAISNQPYAKYARLTFRIFLNSLQALFIAQVLFHSFVHAAAPFNKILVTTGSSSEREGALYVAQDQGYFRKYGLDLTLVQVRNGPVGMSALSSGESLLHWGSVSAANLGAIAEGADLVFVAGFINRLTGAFAVNPAIHSPAELKGKSLGVNSLSGGTWIFTMLTWIIGGCRRRRTKYR
jgi:ABC-type nitrate/sulfonate/bicarbonate transport system substrate-binding protein